MSSREERYARWRTTAAVTWASIGIILLLGLAGWLMLRIFSALVPFVIAFIIVFLLDAPVNALERRGIKRSRGVLLCFLVAALVLGIIATFLLPTLTRQVAGLAASAPRRLAQIDALVKQAQSSFNQIVFPSWLSEAIKSGSAQLSVLAVRLGNGFAATVLKAGSDVAAGLFDLFIALVISYWALKDLPKMRHELTVLVGPKYETDLETMISTLTRVVGGYLKGQTIASLVTGTLATIGLAIIGIPYLLLLGFMVFLFNYVPYLGPFASGVIVGLIGLFQSPTTAVLGVAVVIAAQQITDNFVSPRVMSDQVDLHPTLVIFSLLVGGTLFGIPGMLFAIPVAASAKGLFVYYYEQKTERQLSSSTGALFKDTAQESCEPGVAAENSGEECLDTAPAEREASEAEADATDAQGEREALRSD